MGRPRRFPVAARGGAGAGRGRGGERRGVVELRRPRQTLRHGDPGRGRASGKYRGALRARDAAQSHPAAGDDGHAARRWRARRRAAAARREPSLAQPDGRPASAGARDRGWTHGAEPDADQTALRPHRPAARSSRRQRSVARIAGRAAPQRPPPHGDGGPSPGSQAALPLSVSSQTSWITFSQSDVVRDGEDHDALGARHPEALSRNAGLAARDALPAGMVVLTAASSTLDYSYTNAQIIAMGPATTYMIPVAEGPAPLPLGGLAPRSYGLDHRIELQTPVALPIPGADSAPLSGQPSLWPFSGALRARALAGAPNARDILATRQEERAGRHAGAVTDSTWASVVSITLKQVGSSLSLFT